MKSRSIMYLILVVFIFLIHQILVKFEAYAMDTKYTIMLRQNKNPDSSLVEYHPPMPDDDGTNDVVLSVQEGDILKIAYYDKNYLTRWVNRFDVHNPAQKQVTGMPAKMVSDGRVSGVQFSDGTVMWAYLPPDAQPIGSSEWRYEMRWRKVFKNYYFLVVYRGAETVAFEHLVTEDNGLDISTRLGDSSINADNSKYSAVLLGGKVAVYAGAKDAQFILTPVYEQDLPPDFPKGLVRWVP